MHRFLTGGESHGPALTMIIEGMPAGLPLPDEVINAELARRQGGYGRGGRMKIERDAVEVLGGVAEGVTTGGPIVLRIENRDYANFIKKEHPPPDRAPPRPRRPGGRGQVRPARHAPGAGTVQRPRDGGAGGGGRGGPATAGPVRHRRWEVMSTRSAT